MDIIPIKRKNSRKRQGFHGQLLFVIPKKITTEFLTRDPITRQMYITDIGYYPKASCHYMERSQGIDQHILIYCVEGSGWIELDNARHEIAPSQFFIIPANVPHRYAANEDDPWTIYWIHFKGDASSYINDLLLSKLSNERPHLSFNENRIQLFENICANLSRGYSHDNLRYVSMTFYHFMSSLLYEDKFNDHSNKKPNNIITSAIDLMQKKITTTLTLQECAGFANLSKSHFSALFHEKTGYAPLEYFNHLKIQKACQYLSFTNMSVKEIALTLGIQDQYYFSRMFSKLMGKSPTQYREKTSFHPIPT